MKFPKIPIGVSVLLSFQSFVICFITYFGEGRAQIVGIAACIMAVLTILGLVILPGKH